MGMGDMWERPPVGSSLATPSEVGPSSASRVLGRTANNEQNHNDYNDADDNPVASTAILWRFEPIAIDGCDHRRLQHTVIPEAPAIASMADAAAAVGNA